MKKSINLNTLTEGFTIKLTDGLSDDLQHFSNYGIRLKKDGLWDVVSFTFDKKEGRVLTTRPDKDGYPRIDLISDMGKSRTLFLHRIVGLTLIPQVEGKLFINHIDEDKENCRLENLEWCTHLENMNHGTKTERVAKKRSIPIVQLTLDGEFVKEWDSATQCARELNLSNGSINNCTNGKAKTHGGYRWIRKSEYEKEGVGTNV